MPGMLTAEKLRRQHDAAAFLAVGEQNDAVEALELLAAAAEQEMRAAEQQRHALRPGAGDARGGSVACGLALLLDPLALEEDFRVVGGGCAAAFMQSSAGPKPTPLQPVIDAPNGQVQQHSTAAADVSKDVIIDGHILNSSRENAIQQATALLPDGGSAEPGISSSMGGRDDGAGAPALSAAAAELQQGGSERLPLQGLQAHELVCGRCGTPHETQLVPFFVQLLGALFVECRGRSLVEVLAAHFLCVRSPGVDRCVLFVTQGFRRWGSGCGLPRHWNSACTRRLQGSLSMTWSAAGAEAHTIKARK